MYHALQLNIFQRLFDGSISCSLQSVWWNYEVWNNNLQFLFPIQYQVCFVQDFSSLVTSLICSYLILINIISESDTLTGYMRDKLWITVFYYHFSKAYEQDLNNLIYHCFCLNWLCSYVVRCSMKFYNSQLGYSFLFFCF